MNEYTEHLRISIYTLLDKADYATAKKILDEELVKYETEHKDDLILIGEIAGFLIDIGNESRDLEAATQGVNIMEKYAERFADIVTDQSLFYNIANGKEALHKIKHQHHPLPTLEMIKPDLSEAKNLYYKAYKQIGDKTDFTFALQITSNLSGNLGLSGRMIEAVMYYQQILRNEPKFPQALIGLAENLDHIAEVSGNAHTQALYAHIFINYRSGLQYGNIPPLVKPAIEQRYQYYRKKLEELNVDLDTLDKDFAETEQEYDQLSDYRKFSIANHLTLNEHAIYCPCNAARLDDLSIGHQMIAITGDKAPKMELLLNRIKAEFAMARKLLFESSQEDQSDDVVYNELGDNEVINENSEKLRSAFKMCFGIFDKIAHGICFFYDLRTKSTEPIYFNTFWENNPARWAKIKDKWNPHLLALYGIGNDLNVKSGEFGFYKEWRNSLEHNLIILTSDEVHIDPLKIFSEKDFAQTVSYDYFREQVIHLLQLCRAAIFSFAYCIRLETVQPIPENEEPSYIIRPKKN